MSRPLTQDLSFIQKSYRLHIDWQELSKNYRSHIDWQGLSMSYRLHVGWQELSKSYLILWQILLILQPALKYIFATVLHTFSFLIAFIFWNIFRFSKIFVRDPHLSSIFWESFVLQNFCLLMISLRCMTECWCAASGHQAKNSGRQWLFRGGGAASSVEIEPLIPIFRASAPMYGSRPEEGSLVT